MPTRKPKWLCEKPAVISFTMELLSTLVCVPADEIPGEHVVHRADSGCDAVERDVVVAVEHRPHADALARAQHRVDARHEVRPLVNRLHVLRVVRSPLLARLLVDDAVGHRQQIEHLLAHRTDAILRDDVSRELAVPSAGR